MPKKLWHDPVWSKVIATIVVGIPATIAYFLNWWPWILHWLAAPVRFLGRTSVIPNWLVALLILLAIPTIVWLALTPIRRREAASWKAYTTDNFLGLRWRYFGNDGVPHRLASFCPRCDYQVFPQPSSPFRAIDQISYECENCNQRLAVFDETADFLHNRVERSIQQKLRTGAWGGGIGQTPPS